ncbi:PREDICTED: protein PHYTOCHROME KINASE SUBSTRATE 4-like [Camelina sativa]|uniref:Protein PHYTOCHROME KINASE SUBSTRATE 4-like n=1 Tax=Camelina sativa TaxID=90675 RepID=A0ABM0XTR7_CAMSA|nr:PREDICTED: protein PHYTOCHROME KINASE SUBSTRATE 4-like [Camelina sativa]
MAQTTVTVVATKRDALDPYIKILQNRSNDIDVSFSSYLKPDNNEQRQKEHEDAELSIFEARSYFSENGSNDRCQTRNLSGPRFSSVSSAKVSSCTVGHTASSEASWNSQTGLLSNKNRQGSDRDGRGTSKKGPRWFFRRRACPCSSSKSVQVQESKPRIAVPKTDSDRAVSNRIVHHQTISSPEPIRLTIPSNTVTRSIDYTANREATAPVSKFSFPTLKETTQSSEKPALNPIKPGLNQIEPALHPIKPVLNPTSPKGTIIADEEATSDASSDLFEIESFSTQPTARPWVQPASRDSIDETMSEYGYEPSEASVTWSVMTAEPASAVAANLSRIGLSSSSSLEFSGCDKKRTGLLSCRYEKAVMVSSGQRLVQPLKSVSVQNDVTGKVLSNNGSSKQCVTNRDMLDNKSSFLV